VNSISDDVVFTCTVEYNHNMTPLLYILQVLQGALVLHQFFSMLTAQHDCLIQIHECLFSNIKQPGTSWG